MRIAYLDGARLRRILLAAVDYVSARKAELNRINVFPVPDGDTGTNLALTLQAVADAVRPLKSTRLTEVVHAAAEASLLGARGNSGMLFSNFLLGFAKSIEGNDRIGTQEAAAALTVAARSIQDVLENPKEGTIVTVARELANEARLHATGSADLYWWLHDVQEAAEASLLRTREMLPELREAGVVDAGAAGFVHFFEGILHYVDGDVIEPPDSAEGPLPGTAVIGQAKQAGVGAGEGRYCTQIAIRGRGIPDNAAIRQALAGLGTSTIVLRSDDLAKIHIHADEPPQIRSILAEMGDVVSERIEDTSLDAPSRPVAVVTDSSADLGHDWVERKGVTVIPMQVMVGGETYRDGVDLEAERLLELLAGAEGEYATTSQPAPAEFASRYERALSGGADRILGLFVGSNLSGTYSSAVAALRQSEVTFEAIDSRTASLGLGLLVARAVELVDAGAGLEEAAADLRRVVSQSNILFTVDTFEYLLRSGRVGRAKAMLGSWLDIKPILSINEEGDIIGHERVRGRKALLPRVIALLDEALKGATRYRLGVVHFNAAKMAAKVEKRLRRRYTPVEIMISPVTAALAVHLGPGAWGVMYQIED
ncbi:MAG: DegV family protein [Gemmatimonadota bacterium]